MGLRNIEKAHASLSLEICLDRRSMVPMTFMPLDVLDKLVAELKVALSAVGAPTTGKKQALAARLTALRAAE